MDKDEIIRMAREAGFEPNNSYTILPFYDYANFKPSYNIERFYQMAFAAGAYHEREACAKVCEEYDVFGFGTRDKFAAAIRARSENGTT